MAKIATGNTEEALDIVQDAMTRLVKKYAMRPADEWGPLFYRIVQSLIRDWYRKQKIRNRFRFFWPAGEEQDNPIDTAPDTFTSEPDQELSHGIAVEKIHATLNKMPIRQQQAFILRTLEGLDTKATAAAMQCSQSSVKTHYSRALKTLRHELESHYES